MSIAPKALRQLRIISIPLTRPLGPKKSPSNDRTHVLTYYQFQITTPLKPTTPGDGDSWMSRWRPEGGFGKWVSTKVADTWASFGKAKGGWRVRFLPFLTRCSVLLMSVAAEDIPSRWTTGRPDGVWRASSERHRSITWTFCGIYKSVEKRNRKYCNCNTYHFSSADSSCIPPVDQLRSCNSWRASWAPCIPNASP